MSEKAFKRFHAIFEKTDCKNYTELLRNALKLYEWYIDKTTSGYEVQLVKDKKRSSIELEF